MGLGGAVKLYRERAGLTQGELSEKTGISQAEISRIERGRTQYSRSMPALAKALGCQIGDLSPEFAGLSGQDISLPLIPVFAWADLGGELETIQPLSFMQLSLVGDNGMIASVMPDSSADRIVGRGDTVIVDTDDTKLQNEGVYLFVHEGEPILRIYRSLPDRMHPASSDLNFETQYFTRSTMVIGKVKLSVKTI
jgi:transcriptional regulator with XRE-family HTH domain